VAASYGNAHAGQGQPFATGNDLWLIPHGSCLFNEGSVNPAGPDQGVPDSIELNLN
jgi:hypothetical protein